jgi:hypothetical protein
MWMTLSLTASFQMVVWVTSGTEAYQDHPKRPPLPNTL